VRHARSGHHAAGQAVKVLWSAPAQKAVREISLHIAEHNPVAALKMLDRFSEGGRLLMRFPHAGPKGRIIGTRELFVHSHYLLVYEVIGNTVTILNVLHTSQQYPPLQ